MMIMCLMKVWGHRVMQWLAKAPHSNKVAGPIPSLVPHNKCKKQINQFIKLYLYSTVQQSDGAQSFSVKHSKSNSSKK